MLVGDWDWKSHHFGVAFTQLLGLILSKCPSKLHNSASPSCMPSPICHMAHARPYNTLPSNTVPCAPRQLAQRASNTGVLWHDT